MDQANLKENLLTYARQLGFELTGVTLPRTPNHFFTYTQWLEHGRHGSMHYLANERAIKCRENPGELLPNCQSILILGMRYGYANISGAYPSQEYGQIAAYAAGEDYHIVLIEKLALLTQYIQNLTESPVIAKPYTDTGPILERDLASQAGLGWIGKNTCLIHPRMGSYFLLAELFLDLPLEPDPPFQFDHCGRCTRCIEACPTSCILPDRTLDATRCISYLTIEIKGDIPTEIRPQLGNWIFGCDICQDVCPWNQRFANPEHVLQDFQPRLGFKNPILLEEMTISPGDFNLKFKNSPIKRAKRRGYLRNVAVAIGNTGNEKAIPILANALWIEPEPVVRAHIAWALGNLGGSPARKALEAALDREQDPGVITEIHQAIAAAKTK